MKREKWILGVRKKLYDCHMECDSAAAIEGAKMTPSEREELKKLLRKPLEWIDKRI